MTQDQSIYALPILLLCTNFQAYSPSTQKYLDFLHQWDYLREALLFTGLGAAASGNLNVS